MTSDGTEATVALTQNRSDLAPTARRMPVRRFPGVASSARDEPSPASGPLRDKEDQRSHPQHDGREDQQQDQEDDLLPHDQSPISTIVAARGGANATMI